MSAVLLATWNSCSSYSLKDVRPDVLKVYKDKRLSFWNSVLEGVFTVPGDGCVDYTSIFKILEEREYKGWLVVEAEQNPYIYNSLDYAKLARKYIKELVGI